MGLFDEKTYGMSVLAMVFIHAFTVMRKALLPSRKKM